MTAYNIACGWASVVSDKARETRKSAVYQGVNEQFLGKRNEVRRRDSQPIISMKLYIMLSTAILLCMQQHGRGQNIKRVNDKHIRYQQERMVFKQWDRSKFTPRRGFLGLNYQYWITWALHPRYPNRDRRPLSGTGNQTQRLALVLAMQQVDNAYKKHADTLRNTAVTEITNYSGLFSATDPLWLLYYRQEFDGLLEKADASLLDGLPAEERAYLTDKGIYDWMVDEQAVLRERIQTAHTTDMDRGSRITAYHRLLLEYRQLRARWDAQCRNARQYLALSDRHRHVQGGASGVRLPDRTDVQIATDVLKNVR